MHILHPLRNPKLILLILGRNLRCLLLSIQPLVYLIQKMRQKPHRILLPPIWELRTRQPHLLQEPHRQHLRVLGWQAHDFHEVAEGAQKVVGFLAGIPVLVNEGVVEEVEGEGGGGTEALEDGIDVAGVAEIGEANETAEVERLGVGEGVGLCGGCGVEAEDFAWFEFEFGVGFEFELGVHEEVASDVDVLEAAVAFGKEFDFRWCRR